MTVFFTSDTHYGHKNIIKYSNRPYKTVEEMDETLIKNHNSVVKPDDKVYHIGDVAFRKDLGLLSRLNGTQYLIFGNHDYDRAQLSKYFFMMHDYLEIKVADPEAHHGKQHIVLFHYSMRVWNKSHHGSWQLYGHSHGTLYDDPNLLSMDVGVDPRGYFPISYEQVKAHMKTKTFKPTDHHGAD
jgi:calcineurin-like phosphoesterase family protein